MSLFDDPHLQDQSLGARVAQGAVWLVVMRWTNQVLGLASMLVLARFLVPEDFGIIALASASIAVVEGLASLPTSQAIIRLPDAEPSVYDTAWTLAVFRGTAVALIVIGCAPWVAAAMNEHRLQAVIFVLALQPVLLGLQNPRFIDFDRSLDFSRAFTLEIGTRLLIVAVTVISVFFIRSYWAIVVGSLVGAAVRTLWTYVLKPYVPRFSLTEFRKIFGFSAWLSAARLVGTLNLQADKFLVAGFLNTGSVGLYHMATTLAQSLIGSVTDPLVRGLYPAFTQVSTETSRLKEHVLGASAVLMAVVLPLGFGLALVSNELVQLLLGPRWYATIPILHVLVPVFSLRALTAVTDPLVMAIGATRLLFYRACVMILTRVGLITIGLAYFGLMGAVYGWALSSLLAVGLHLQLFSRTLRIPFFMPVTQAWRTWIALASMILGVVLLPRVFEGPTSLAMSFLTKTLAGGIIYCCAHVLLWLMAGQPRGAESRIFSVMRSWTKASRRIAARGN